MIKRIFEKLFRLEPEVCNSCEVLKMQVNQLIQEKQILLKEFINSNKSYPDSAPSVNEEKEYRPIVSQFTPWRVRQQFLEQEDKERARVLKKSVEELEHELGIPHPSDHFDAESMK